MTYCVGLLAALVIFALGGAVGYAIGALNGIGIAGCPPTHPASPSKP